MFDRKTFFDAVRTSVFDGHLTPSQVSGCSALLAEWEAKFASNDTRWLAYALCTALWETARTMQPIEEYGHGAGRSYSVAVGPYNQIYYGRGYVQLTLYANYVADTSKLRALGILGADEDLAKTPSLALRPDVAAAVLFYGMVQGWFTGKKLGDYFTATASDWADARKIVNGTDHAADVAKPALAFLAALQQAAGVGAVAKAIPPATPLPPASSAPSSAPAGAAPTAAESTDMNPISILIDLFGGVAGKLGAASAVATVAPHVISGAISSVEEIPTVVKEIEALIADVKAGKWSDIPNAAEALVSEFGTILGKFGVQLPVLTTMVDKMVPAATSQTAIVG